jgi:ubiquitin conjugation factor E4 B
MEVKPIVHLFVTIIASPKYLNNPYLRAKLVEVFCAIADFPTSHGAGSEKLRSVFKGDEFVEANLTPALIRLFIDIEHTGSTYPLCSRVHATRP